MKIEDFTKIINNLSLYFENWGAAIFKEHLSVAGTSLSLFILTINSDV